MPQPVESPQAIFASNVERIRLERGLTQERLGWASELHQTAVARIESGERAPGFGTILKLARGLGVTPAELFRGID